MYLSCYNVDIQFLYQGVSSFGDRLSGLGMFGSPFSTSFVSQSVYIISLYSFPDSDLSYNISQMLWMSSFCHVEYCQ